jgi:hypothetical protein
MELILKEALHTVVDVVIEGYISIEQRSDETGEFVAVLLTPDQLKAILKWLARNHHELDEAWNGGVEQ